LNQSAPEEGGLGKAGLYRHPESGEEMHTLSDPLFGEAQSNAAVQLGFVRVRDSKPEEIKSVLDFSVANVATENESLKGLAARVNQLEGVAEENKKLTAEVEKFRKASLATADPVNIAGHDAKTEAARVTKLRDQAPDADPTKQVGPAPTKAPSEPLNSDRELPEDTRVHVRDENRKDLDEGNDGDEGGDGDEPELSEEERVAKEKQNQANARRHAELSDKPLEKDNFTATELAELAKLEGVEVEGLNSKQEFVDAIKAARDEKESEN
jgi:hypothetical protein